MHKINNILASHGSYMYGPERRILAIAKKTNSIITTTSYVDSNNSNRHSKYKKRYCILEGYRELDHVP